MSIGTIRDAANIQYGGLYIPIASWFYIYKQNPSKLAFYSIPIVLLGATIAHSILYSIFGPEGPRAHPKKNFTVAGYSLALLYTKTPGRNPDTVDEFYERLGNTFTIRRSIRFSLLLVITSAYILLTIYSLKPLYQASITGESLIPGLLLLTQTIFFAQGFMMNRFANVLPPEEAEWVWVPEFRRVLEIHSEEEYEDHEYRDPPLILNNLKEQLDDLLDSLSTEDNPELEQSE